MARPPRSNPGGYVYHVLNRANARAALFHKDRDYAGFLRVLAEAQQQNPLRLLAYCLMPNHWHLVLWPAEDNQLSAFLHWLTLTHTVRWLSHFHCVGSGHVYQGRFKSFPVCCDEHLFTVCRYVERNALRAGLTERAEAWPWGSLWQRVQGQQPQGVTLSEWPLPLPADWPGWVNQHQTEAELFSVRECVKRGRPYGGEAWVRQTAKALHLDTTLRPRGRPRKPQPAEPLTEPVG
jgi:putative transposase